MILKIMKKYKNYILFILWTFIVLIFHHFTDTFDYSLIVIPENDGFLNSLKFISSTVIYSFLLLAIPVIIFTPIVKLFKFKSSLKKRSQKSKINDQLELYNRADKLFMEYADRDIEGEIKNLQDNIKDGVNLADFSKLYGLKLRYEKSLKDKKLSKKTKDFIKSKIKELDVHLSKIDKDISKTNEKRKILDRLAEETDKIHKAADKAFLDGFLNQKKK